MYIEERIKQCQNVTSSGSEAMERRTMIIGRVSKVKNAGVWKNYSAPSGMELKSRTIIFGFNGSGKTTLSRIFSSIQRGSVEDRLPSELEFEINFSDGQIVNQNNLENSHLEKNLLVFNSDYTSRNIMWDTGSAEGIAYISERKIETRKEYEKVTKEIEKIREEKDNIVAAKENSEKDLGDFKTQIARQIREQIISVGYTQRYDSRKIEQRYSDTTYTSEQICSDDDLSNAKSILHQKDALEPISFSPDIPIGLMEWQRNSYKLVQEPIINIAVSEFEKHSSELRWLEQGLDYHDSQKIPDCILCGNPFTENRRAQLRALFSESWKEALKELDSILENGYDFRKKLRDLYSSFPNELKVVISQRDKYVSIRDEFQEKIKELGVYVGAILKYLETKKNKPTETIKISEDISNFKIAYWAGQFERINVFMKKIIDSHNEESNEFSSRKSKAREKIEAHILAQNQGVWDKLNDAFQIAKQNLINIQKTERTLSDRYRQLHNELQDHGKGAEKLNKLMWDYLGHKELELIVNPGGGYKIVRPNQEPAKNLSEGERTAISFCYFLTQLASEGRDIEKLILVIDDPVSSLDTTARTHAFSLLSSMTKSCAQVVVLTHNIHFMNMIKRDFLHSAKWKNKDKTAFLSLECRNIEGTDFRVTSLEKMHSLLLNYESEYHYLFSLVYNAAFEKEKDYQYLLPNVTRKMLEIFLSFRSPGKANFSEAIMEYKSIIKDKIDIKALERLVQIESHGTMEGLDTLPSLTIQDAIRAAEAGINFIKITDKDHYRKMEKILNKTDS